MGVDIPPKHQQIVLVQTDSWDSSTGILKCYSKNSDGWFEDELEIKVVVGKSGLGWGRGLHVIVKDGPEKNEGDGKAPAGVFEFGDVFGYSSQIPEISQHRYRQLTERDYFIDDVNSADYNRWITISNEQENNPRNLWGSFERMKRSDHLYELGIVVEHNFDPVENGKGSAIFLHVWRKEGYPTVGCTAMKKKDLIDLISWLNPAKNPIFIQIPKSEMAQIKFK